MAGERALGPAEAVVAVVDSDDWERSLGACGRAELQRGVVVHLALEAKPEPALGQVVLRGREPMQLSGGVSRKLI